jgi:hypothetical protein
VVREPILLRSVLHDREIEVALTMARIEPLSTQPGPAASPPAPAFPPEPQSCGRLHGAQHISEPAKVNAGFSMYHRPAISIAIDPARCLTASAAPAPVAVTTGTNIGDSAAGRTRRPVRAALRHPNRCCGVMSCRRATSDTTTPCS